MAPLTKKKSSKSHTKERRAHFGIKLTQLVDCPQCHNQKMPHEACPVCGTYRGHQAIKIEEPKKKTE
jgi:large subunit ribosomal protein L32